jgi:formamidase
LRTIPPRENGGNLDLKQFVPGARVFLPVYNPGALVSLGDAHFAQGDGETCGTAIEMRARMHLRFHVRRGLARDGVLPWPVFATATTSPPEGRRLGVVGLCVENDRNYSQDLTVAARQAVSSLIGLLGRAGYSPEQAYVIASVAADLHVGQVVDVPNVSVTALLPLDIFDDGGTRVMNGLRGEDPVSV